MLATNQDFYKRILRLEIFSNSDDGSVDWAQFFDQSSSYRLLYTLQIVQAMLGEGVGSPERAAVLNADSFPSNKARFFYASYRDDEKADGEEELPSLKKSTSTSSDTQEDLAKLRGQWASAFLQKGGFRYILKDFMACSHPESSSHVQSEPFELKYIAFMLHILRTLTAAAFSTSDPSAYQGSLELARRRSETREDQGEKGRPAEE